MTGTNRLSMALVLENLRRRGFQPATVVDVGAHSGTPLLSLAFPGAHHVMVEPLVEHGPALQAACDKLASAEYLLAAASCQDGALELFIDRNSLHGYGKEAGGERRLVRSLRLDRLAFARGWKGPFLIKVDVDGAELDVLMGMAGLLGIDDLLIVETTLFSGNILKIMNFMDGFGFVPFDLADPLYRESDDALWQFDLVFVHGDSFLRKHRGYP